jgi:hypothetical protein
MDLEVVGAGVGRTGTLSLKAALERLLGGACYHMSEAILHPEHIPYWQAAAQGDGVDWDAIFDGYVATVDWPAASFWPELVAANPDALVVLSVRDNAEQWWRSASTTIFEVTRRFPPERLGSWGEMWSTLARTRFTERLDDPSSAIAAYERHNDAVRAGVPPDRLLEWRPGDGWAPICERLGRPVPSEPFPHVNNAEDTRAALDHLPDLLT